MILGVLLIIFAPIILALLGLLPEPESLPGNIADAFDQVAPYVGTANYFFPMDTVFQIIVLGLAIESGILLFKLGNWGFNKIRGAG